MRPEPIAVVGLGGIFPQAPDLDTFWANIASGHCASREVPEGRWALSKTAAFDPARGAPDKVYSLKACLVEGFRLDPSGLDLDRRFLEELDPLYHLALHAARQAWLSAKTARLDRSRVGVAIGNIVLPTDASSALCREVLLAAFEEKALGRKPEPLARRTHPINRFVAGLPAGLIARALKLGGGAYALDAACASSLYAVKLAVDELRAGRADAVITGGVSRPESLYTQMGFSQLRALSASGRPAPFDAGADGLVVGEGAGMFVLKRLEDARRDGDNIHGLIAGAGLSNDVGGSLLAPNSDGQLRAMRRAYQQAGWAPSDADLIECHATGTPTGDPIEAASLKALWGEGAWTPGRCAIGSVKSNVGHLLTGAGAAGLMKVLLALRERTLPPSANFERAHPQLGLDGSPFRVLSKAEPWTARGPGLPRRAAVSAFGFGGINAHILVEEHLQARRATARGGAPSRSPSGREVAIGIVGMEARFGSLQGLRPFQEAALSGSAPEATPAPAARWWGAARPESGKGHYLREASAGTADYRIPPKELEESLPQQVLMLEAAGAALKDAGLLPGLPGERTGVFIGLGLDFNTTNFHLRWGLAAKAKEWARERGWRLSAEDEASWLAALREAAGPALSANRTMGALGGIVASRVAREFSVGGPAFTLSSEETSGLRALEIAARALRSGELDCALVGAVDVAGDVRQVLATAQIRPFSTMGAARPFDQAADGTLVGEGAAALVLMRLEDAVKQGRRVYAVLKGTGFSTGGGVDSPAPSSDACRRALEKAYAESGVDPSTVGYLEAAAGGAPAEDRAEAQALADFFGTAAPSLPCALGSVKALVGHAGAASGLAGVVRAALALYQEILPPFLPPAAAAAFKPIPELERAKRRFHLPIKPQYWLRNRAEHPRRAGVTALGSDGTAAHAVLEGFEHAPEDARPAAERLQPLGARREALFAVEADQPKGLIAGLAELSAWASEADAGSNIEALARRWWRKRGGGPDLKLGLALVARDWKELLALCRQAQDSLAENPERPIPGDRVHLTTRPPFEPGSVAFVFPGSGNQYLGMGMDLGVQWPEVLRAQDRENGYLRGQLVPERFYPWRFTWEGGWPTKAESAILQDYQAMIFGSVSHGTALSDLLRSFGVKPSAVIGYSLGETAGLFALRAWTARDEMLRRMKESSLFVSDLAGPCDAVRQFWNLPPDEKVDWVLGVIDRPADAVKLGLKGMEKAGLLIVNAPFECVVGGYRKAVDSLVEGLGAVFLPLQGVSTVHFPAAELVKTRYRDLHLLPTTPPPGVRFYSGAWAKAYELTRERAADSITAQAIRPFDFSALVRQAYEDGVRVFLEMGPQVSCSRMIGKILGPKPHLARSADRKGEDASATVLKMLAALIAERVPVNLSVLYGRPTLCAAHQEPAPERPRVRAALGGAPFRPVSWTPAARTPALPPAPPPEPAAFRPSIPAPAPSRPAPVATQTRPLPAAPSAAPVAVLSAAASAHDAFLSLSAKLAQAQAENLAYQNALLGALSSGAPIPAAPLPTASPKVFMDRAACLEFAVGRIGKALGEAFAEADSFPTRVRLPGEPLMLVDRILSVSGEPKSLKSGTVVTEHDVLPGSWYLDAGRIPTCVAVEAGQADLFLSGYLGIDFKTKGLAVYRLLDAEVAFHGPLPIAGETIRYDIAIDRFVQHGDAWLFFFRFDGSVAGRPLITMRNGCAGFFTDAALAAGKGVVLTEEERAPAPGKRPADWRPLAPVAGPESYSDAQLDSLRRGDLAAAFGPAFAGLKVEAPLTLPSGRMKLVDRILELDPAGGRYGLGLVRGEADIRPDDWHLVCHFTDDNVMPGTLMYECCLHTLRVLLLRLGWVGEQGRAFYEPVREVKSGLKCRGQVLPGTRKVRYEVSVKELGYDAEGAPYAIADALMFSDGKAIVQITDMSLRMGGTTREGQESLWTKEPHEKCGSAAIFDRERILAFAVGKPSDAFGERYKPFDSERVIARLPGPPYQFLDRITRIQGCKPWELAAGGVIEARYDVPRDAWYFQSNAQPQMPFAVLLEAALQPCGWLAAYLGSALTSPIDLSFRNLGGTATQFMEVGPDAGTLVTRVKITKVSQSGGMIIQNYAFDMSTSDGRPVYKGVTEFGFFTKVALSQQIGIRGAKPFEGASGRAFDPAAFPGMPDPMLLMLDSVELGEGGPKGLGWAKGLRKVNPSEWFFKAHFYQDPVCPGSLGLESFIQAMKALARERWGAGRFESMALGLEHSWLYRGQYTPVNKQVEVSAVVTRADDREKLLVAEGHLKADGLTIYAMKDFALRLR